MTRLSTAFKTLALSLAVMTSTGLVFAASNTAEQAPAKAHGIHKMHKSCNIMGKLGLSDEQREKLKTQHETFRQENATLISDMKAKLQQLRALPRTPENQAQRKQLRAEFKQARQELHTKHMAMMQQVLTPDQFQRYTTLKQQCKAEWHKKKQAAEPKEG